MIILLILEGRFVFDAFRFIVFLTTEFDSWLYNISRSLGMFWFLMYILLFASLVDAWVNLCVQCLQYGKILRWINYLIIFFAITLNFISAAVTMTLESFPLTYRAREIGDTLLKFMAYPCYIIGVIALTVILVIAGILIVREMRIQSSKWNMKSSAESAAIRKIFAAIIVTVICSIFRVLASIAIGVNLLVILGEWISIVTYIPEFASLLIIGFVFFPWERILHRERKRKSLKVKTKFNASTRSIPISDSQAVSTPETPTTPGTPTLTECNSATELIQHK